MQIFFLLSLVQICFVDPREFVRLLMFCYYPIFPPFLDLAFMLFWALGRFLPYRCSMGIPRVSTYSELRTSTLVVHDSIPDRDLLVASYDAVSTQWA